MNKEQDHKNVMSAEFISSLIFGGKQVELKFSGFFPSFATRASYIRLKTEEKKLVLT